MKSYSIFPRISGLIFWIFLMVLFLPRFIYGQHSPNLIFINGNIFTSDTSQLFVEALAVKDHLILATGTTSEIQKLADNSTTIIDLKGKTVVPGFNNGHDHLGWNSPIGKQFSEPFSIMGPTEEKILESVGEMVRLAKPGQWIRGMIGNTVWADQSISRKLDSISPENPVLLQIMWGHGMILNRKGREEAGFDPTQQDPLGGWFGRKTNSDSLNGTIHEYAQWPVWYTWTGSEQDQLVAGIQTYLQEMLSYGITSVQDFSSMIDPSAIEAVFSKVNSPLRLRLVPFPGTSAAGRDLKEWLDLDENPSELTRISGVKYMIDGTPLEQNALFKKPYDSNSKWFGRLNMPMDTVRSILSEAAQSDIQLMLHVVGDSTLSLILPLMKEIASPEVWRQKRIRLEHGVPPGLSKEDWIDIKAMGIVLMPTPQYIAASPVKSLLRNGIPIGIAPDMLTNPFVNIMLLSDRQVLPEENISRVEAVIAYTFGNAFAEFAENEKGTLTKGKLADFAVLTYDIFKIPIDQLPLVTSVLTLVNGKIVYQIQE
jgi:predicted amidohydrolase YtcJ